MIPGAIVQSLLQAFAGTRDRLFTDRAIIEIRKHYLVRAIVRIVFQQGLQQTEFAVRKLLLHKHTWPGVTAGAQIRKRPQTSIQRQDMSFWQSILQIKVKNVL